MPRSSILFIIAGLLIGAVIIVIILLTAAFTPENTNPAFATAVDFVQAAGTGDDEAAFALLDPTLQGYVQANCPNGRIATCIQSYMPTEWGAFRSVVFRRATPNGASAWDVDLIATYAEGKGFSGVCIYSRVEQSDSGAWWVTAWAGFVHCGDSASRNMATNPDAPNRVP